MGQRAARGFSIFSEDAPLIAVNTHWNAAARVFTLIHELAHLVSRTNSVCIGIDSGRDVAPSTDLERWCETVGAAVLLPASADLQFVGQQQVGLEVAGKVARRFRVSLRAAALRLIQLGLATWNLYGSLPPASDSKPTGGGGSGRRRPMVRIDEYGKKTIRPFLRGIERQVISPSEAMDYLDVSYSNLESLASMV
jgi:Zn-dependent peptidase ImmA (M78 family)